MADKLDASARSLDDASNELAVFGQQVVEASRQQRDAAEASRVAAASGERTAKALEPLPATINTLTDGLAAAGASVRGGAESARESYQGLIELQRRWFDGAELGLTAMKDRLQALMTAYGDQIDGQTQHLMNRWTTSVRECLQSYETQVQELQGGLDELLARSIGWSVHIEIAAMFRRRETAKKPTEGENPSC